jgi:hypothetical protein
MRTRAQIVERAQLHVGHRETAPNDSLLIRAWLRRCGIDYPAAWCAAFASWCLEDRNMAGAVKLGKSFPATSEPQSGDLMWFPTGGGRGHVGIVVDVLPELALCIEGNSANRVRYVQRRRSAVRFSNTRPDERWMVEPTASLKLWDTAPLVEVTIEGTR